MPARPTAKAIGWTSESGMQADSNRRLQQVRGRRLADRAEHQRADGDAELVARHHQRHVLHRAQRRPREAGALLGAGLDLRTAGRDQRELRADEERVREQQDDRDQERRGAVTHRRSSPGPPRRRNRRASSRTRSTRAAVEPSSTSRTSPTSHGVAAAGTRPSPCTTRPAIVS